MDSQAYYTGNSAFYKDLKRYVSFPTRSDAMIASLALACKVSPDVMDIVFSIIHDQSFNSSDMTLRKTEDIYIHLSKHDSRGGKNAASKMDDRGINGLYVGLSPVPKSIPPIVLDAVIALIDESIRNGTPSPPRDSRDMKNVLRSLALVQRRYTRPARQALGRFLHLQYSKRKDLLKRCLANPLIGPWTRQLRFSMSVAASYLEVSSAMKTLRIALAEHITGLRKLIWIFDDDTLLSTDLLGSTFASLRSVDELVLDLTQFSKDKRVSASHYRSIISMPSLRNLVLQFWDIPDTLDIPCQGLPSWFAQFTPSLSFQLLHLYHPCFRFQYERSRDTNLHLIWTRDLHDNFFLSTLVVQFTFGARDEDVDEVCQRLPPLLQRLEVLYVAELPHNKEEYLSWFLSHCPKTLRRLFFQSRNFLPETVLQSIPRTMRKLSLQFGDSSVLETLAVWEDIDTLLHRLILIDIWPELLALNVYCLRDCHRRQPEIPPRFVRLSRTRELCAERHIKVSVTILGSSGTLFYEEYYNGVLEGMNIMHPMGVFFARI